MELTYDKRLELHKLTENYRTIETFVKNHKRLSYMQFDYSVVHDLTLFMMEPDLSFDELESKTDVVLSALPSIKRIFAQPCIHLKETDVIVPIESVRKINNNTIQHIASHSELWEDIKNNEIKPTKLLTKTYEDDYGIYENIVFCKTIDDVLSFARTNIHFLKELIYTNQTIEINLLERVNHLNYFLALGKLHIGYSRNFDSYYAVSVRCLNKLQFLTNSIVPRLKRPVYKNNRMLPEQLRLHKTNILSMHKEYHRIYKLAKYLSANSVNVDYSVSDRDIKKLQKNYFSFCEALSVFAIGHFNFACNEDKLVDFSRLNMTFTFKQWKLKLKKVTCDGWNLLSFCIRKNKAYNIILIPSVFEKTDELLQAVKDKIKADEYIVCTPYENDEKRSSFIDITSIESFRRIQQFVLRGMIYADSKRTECPFCNNKLSVNAEKSSDELPVYECRSCRTEILTERCPATEKTYVATRIEGLHKTVDINVDSWLAQRQKEAQMFFRNITDLNDDMEIVCPHCGKVHK